MFGKHFSCWLDASVFGIYWHLQIQHTEILLGFVFIPFVSFAAMNGPRRLHPKTLQSECNVSKPLHLYFFLTGPQSTVVPTDTARLSRLGVVWVIVPVLLGLVTLALVAFLIIYLWRRRQWRSDGEWETKCCLICFFCAFFYEPTSLMSSLGSCSRLRFSSL